jgi:hypothetical protein
MYNAEIKNMFAKSYTTKASVRKVCRQLFDVAEKYETHWGADLCTRISIELEPIIDEAAGLTAQGRQMYLKIFQSYIKWCIDQKIFPNVCDDLLTVTSVMSKKFKHQTITSPKHLQKYLDSVFEQEDLLTIDILYRTFFWLAYAGVSLNDVFELKNQDFDFDNMLVRCKDKSYPIYREGVKALRLCVNLSYIQLIRGDTGVVRRVDRINSDLIMRGTRSIINKQSIQERISHKQKDALDKGKTDLTLSFFKVWISGLFYRMYIDEISGIKPNFFPFIKEIDDARGTKNKTGALNRRAEYYYEDYLCWKNSFSQ